MAANRAVPGWLASGVIVALLLMVSGTAFSQARTVAAEQPAQTVGSNASRDKATTQGDSTGGTNEAITVRHATKNGVALMRTLSDVKPQVSGITYAASASTGNIIPGVTDTGNHSDDATTPVTFPFPLTFYGRQFTSGNVGANGNLQFTSSDPTYTPNCLPLAYLNNAIFLYQDDLTTNGPGLGVFSAVLGSAPNRQYILEWRAQYFGRVGDANAELIFYENSPNITMIYGMNIDNGDQEVSGLQEGTGTSGNSSTQFSCQQGTLNPGRRVDYVPTQSFNPTATPTFNPCQVGWSEAEPYLISIVDAAVARQGGFIYSFSGVSGGAVINNAYKFNGSAWYPIAPMPQYLDYASATSDGQYLYIYGGVNGNTNASSPLLYRYDPASNSYTQLAATGSNNGTWGQTLTYLNGKIYRVAGSSTANFNPIALVKVYTIATNTWTQIGNYPIAVGLHAAVAIGGYIYAGGGSTASSGQQTTKTYRFDPSSGTWDDAAIADLPFDRSSMASDVFNGKWMINGGFGANGTVTLRTTIAWNGGTNNWESLADSPYTRARGQGATLGSNFYTVGGAELSDPDFFQGHIEVQRYSLGDCATLPPGGTPTTPQPTNTFTNTPAPPTNTATNTNTPPPTVTPRPTNTPTPTWTPGGPTATPTPTNCPLPFTDLNGNIFLPAITYLYCRGVVNGTGPTTFSPAGTSTRAQFAKVVVLGFGVPSYTPPGGTRDFTDVAPTYFAYAYIEAGFNAGILSGFDAGTCGSAGAQFPCYLPNRPITRAQITKLVVSAAQYVLITPTGGQPSFTDVPRNSIFFPFIETAYAKGVINGYSDGTFRPNTNVRRDAMCQIVYKGVTTP